MIRSEIFNKLTKEKFTIARCKFWATCNTTDCDHYDPHRVDNFCILLSPVKYCCVAKGFVHCIPMHEIECESSCNPNLAFKTYKDARKRKVSSVAGTYKDRSIQSMSPSEFYEYMVKRTKNQKLQER
jgi:hypothetical protein